MTKAPDGPGYEAGDSLSESAIKNFVAGPPEPRRAGAFRLIIFAAIAFGIGVTEEVSNQVLPLTIQRITAGFSWSAELPFRIPFVAPDRVVTMGSALIVGLILAINPFFGFVVQPIVGVLSDRIWTSVGRRAFFLIIASPVVAACLFAVPFASVLWELVILVVIYQFFQDVLWGSNNPLLADLFPSNQRGIAAAAAGIAYQLSTVFVTRFGISAIDAHEIAQPGALFGAPIYWSAAACQVALVMSVAFLLWERRPSAIPRTKLTLGRYIRDFRETPGLPRLGMLNFFRSYMVTAGNGFFVLFGTVTLAATKAEFSRHIGWLPLLALPFLWPAGVLTDRINRSRLLVGAFGLAAVGYLVGSLAADLTSLAIAFLVARIAWMFINVAYDSLVTEYYPRDKIGQFAGAINIFSAVGRTMALITVGAIIGFFGDNYRVAWIVAILSAMINIAVTLSIKDPRCARNPV